MPGQANPEIKLEQLLFGHHDRNLIPVLPTPFQFTNFWDRAYNGEIPPIVRDPYWDAEDINLPTQVAMNSGHEKAWISSASTSDPFQGSLANVDYTGGRRMSIFVH